MLRATPKARTVPAQRTRLSTPAHPQKNRASLPPFRGKVRMGVQCPTTVCGARLRAALKANCGSRPAGGLLSLACPRESNQREGHPGRSPRKHRAVPCAPRPTGALRNSHCPIWGNAQTVLAKAPRWGWVLGELQRDFRIYTGKNKPKPNPRCQASRRLG